MDLKDKARAKEARRAAKKDEQRTTKGPQIAWDQPGGAVDMGVVPPGPAAPASPTAASDDTTDDSAE